MLAISVTILIRSDFKQMRYLRESFLKHEIDLVLPSFKKMRLYNHRFFFQNRFINECAIKNLVLGITKFFC